jgi:tetratricopeptide (TPR) repeat protein
VPADDEVTAPPVHRDERVAEVPSVERYALLERLGEGGMGVVWAAQDRVLDRKVALKVLHDDYLGAIDQQRLAEEARAMARLSHPNVVTVYDFGELDGRTFLTMELVDGEPLSRWLAEPRRWQMVVTVFREICSGLAVAHEAGIVHRDVKPSNIMIGADGRPKIADFGIARAGMAAGSPPRRHPDASAHTGTPAYMPPERLRGELADERGDQFSCCVTLYEALCRRRPFEAESPAELLRAIEAGVPPPDGSVPRWLHGVIARGLSADPAARFPSMRALETALRGPRRRRWPIALAAGLALGSGALVFGLRGTPSTPCADAANLDGTWSPRAALQLLVHFGATGVPYAGDTGHETVRILERYATDWTTMHGDACRATRIDHVQSAVTLERRNLCLERRRQDLARVIGALVTIDASDIKQAPAMARGLPPVSDCADPKYLTGLATAAPSIEEDLGLARTLLFSGHYDEGRATAQRVIDAAHASHDRVSECAATVVRGRLESLAHDPGASIVSLRAAAALAAELGKPRLRAEALIFLSATLQTIGRLPEASDVLDTADTILATTRDPLLAAHAESARGTLLGRQTRYEDAVPHLRRALDGFGAVYGLDSDALVPLLDNLALALRRSGHADEALQLVRRARDLSLSLGETHPTALKARRDLAITLGQAGAPGDAEKELRALHETWRHLRPDGDLDVALSASDLGTTLSTLHRNEEALALFREALSIRERLAPGARQTLMERANVADTLNQLGRPQEAEPLLREILEQRQHSLGEIHGDVALGHIQLGSALSQLGRYDEARAEYEHARHIYEVLHGARHPAVARVIYDEGVNERARHRLDAAARLARQALDMRLETLPAGSLERLESLVQVATDLDTRGAHAKAIELARQAADESHGDAVEAVRARALLEKLLRASP